MGGISSLHGENLEVQIFRRWPPEMTASTRYSGVIPEMEAIIEN